VRLGDSVGSGSRVTDAPPVASGEDSAGHSHQTGEGRPGIVQADTDRSPVSWADATQSTSLRGRKRERTALKQFMTSVAGTVLVGRHREQAVVDQLLLDVHSGHSRSLVLRGEPGIGKTALLDDMVARAEDMAVVRLSGVQSEADLAYGALYPLWSRFTEDGVSRLPEPQGLALRAAFGVEAGPPPSVFLVGLAILNGLAELAEQHSLVVAVDDTDWLDPPSAQTLSFVARRLQAEGVGLVFAARQMMAELEGLLELPIAGLAPEDARRLLGSVLRVDIDEAILDRFIAETEGNPLAILELSSGLASSDPGEMFDQRDPRGLWVQLEDRFRRRVQALNGEAEMLLLIAAAEPSGDPLVFWRAVDLLGCSRDAAGALQEAGLLSVGTAVVFRHPLVRSASYRSASVDARRSVHRALSEAVDGNVDPDRRALHRALAAPGPDEEVAVELERSADRARMRGGYAAAASFLERALALTSDRARRASRALAAAEAKLAAGEPRPSRDLLSIVEKGPLDALSSVKLELLRARIAFALGRGADAPALLLKAAKNLEPLDPIGARDAYLDAMRAVLFAGRFAKDTDLWDVAVAARGVVWPEMPRVPDLLLRAFASLIVDGYAAGAPLAQEAVAALRDDECADAADLGSLVLGAQLAATLWDEAAYDDLTQRQVRLARETGALEVLPIALTNRAITHLLAGELAAAVSLVEEIEVISEATGTPPPPYAAVAVAAHGPPDVAHALIDANLQSATDRGEGAAVKWIQLEKAILCNALGRYEDAWIAAESAYENPVRYSTWIAGELIESAARSGRSASAARAVEDLREMASTVRTDWVLGVETRCRALLADGEIAEDLYRCSIAHMQRTRLPVELARSHLAYGEWLRRRGRRIDARRELRSAREIFDSLGAVAFTDRATRELAATGERVQKRSSVASQCNDLTERESQIARLAAEGLSNREIGQQLFISHRTVGYHLAKVFSKLGVNNRALLGASLEAAVVR
jgi:DNA-binding CsgD family transcriptional regulator